jgi:hypothetical protein
MEIGFHTNEYSIYILCESMLQITKCIECHKDRLVTLYLKWLGVHCVHVFFLWTCEDWKRCMVLGGILMFWKPWEIGILIVCLNALEYHWNFLPPKYSKINSDVYILQSNSKGGFI